MLRPLLRHARACRGHPRLAVLSAIRRGWPEQSPATTADRASRARTSGQRQARGRRRSQARLRGRERCPALVLPCHALARWQRPPADSFRYSFPPSTLSAVHAVRLEAARTMLKQLSSSWLAEVRATHALLVAATPPRSPSPARLADRARSFSYGAPRRPCRRSRRAPRSGAPAARDLRPG